MSALWAFGQIDRFAADRRDRSVTIVQVRELVDIHCHILAGIDDGPETMAQSIEMARAAAEAGITTVAATPHLRSDFPKVKVDEIADRCADLQARIVEEGIELTVIPAGEVGLSWALEASDDMLRRASYRHSGTDLLIETPTVGGAMLPSLLGQVRARSYRVTLAHPERLTDFQEDPSVLDRINEQGVLLQVNADGVLGNPRKSRSAKLAHALCQQGLTSVIASDGHRGTERRPVGRLAQAIAPLSELVGDDAVPFLTESIPVAILAGEPIPKVPWLEREPARRRFWQRG
jgi:protein-tyrosine phosphatase